MCGTTVSELAIRSVCAGDFMFVVVLLDCALEDVLGLWRSLLLLLLGLLAWLPLALAFEPMLLLLLTFIISAGIDDD